MITKAPMVTKYLSIIIPVYNEGENIEKVIRMINERVDIPYKLIVVYDFDEDNTVPVIRKLQGEYQNIQLEKNAYGRGPVNAVITGFGKNDSDFICILSADLSDEIDAIKRMYDLMLDGFDVVGATRYKMDGKKIGGPWFKTQLSRFLNLLFHQLTCFPLSDITYSFRMYRQEVIEVIEIETDAGWEISMEIAIKAYLEGFKITEIPVVWIDRELGSSKFHLFKWAKYYFKWFFFGIVQINKKGDKLFRMLFPDIQEK